MPMTGSGDPHASRPTDCRIRQLPFEEVSVELMEAAEQLNFVRKCGFCGRQQIKLRHVDGGQLLYAQDEQAPCPHVGTES
jgi:hypothetical protein